MAEEFKTIVDSSFDNANFPPFWAYTKDYIFGMIPANAEGSRWTEVSYTFEEPEEPLLKTERNADLSYQFLLEEVSKGLAFYVEDLNVNNIKEFAKSIESKSGPDKIKALISELINNSSEYSKNLPIVKDKSGLGILKEKV
ncbi:MAG: hypothetical protein EU539_05550 [Promethearchaeota archaeon]|nr:MAG: hypothetical protein EU539_05550 [Candidatus Lokiarchaeota archaeon]